MTPERFARLKQALARRQPDLTVLTEQVHKPHNLAAIARSCDAVGVMEIHAVNPRGRTSLPKGTASGSRDWVSLRPHARIGDAVSHLKANNFYIVAAHFSENSVDYRVPDYTRPTALLLGAELFGVSPEAAALADESVIIPMRGLVKSLNVSVAAALLLFEAARQREAAGCYAGTRLSPAEFDRLLFEWCWPEVAARCREAGTPYPGLDHEGRILSPSG